MRTAVHQKICALDHGQHTPTTQSELHQQRQPGEQYPHEQQQEQGSIQYDRRDIGNWTLTDLLTDCQLPGSSTCPYRPASNAKPQIRVCSSNTAACCGLIMLQALHQAEPWCCSCRRQAPRSSVARQHVHCDTAMQRLLHTRVTSNAMPFATPAQAIHTCTTVKQT